MYPRVVVCLFIHRWPRTPVGARLPNLRMGIHSLRYPYLGHWRLPTSSQPRFVSSLYVCVGGLQCCLIVSGMSIVTLLHDTYRFVSQTSYKSFCQARIPHWWGLQGIPCMWLALAWLSLLPWWPWTATSHQIICERRAETNHVGGDMDYLYMSTELDLQACCSSERSRYHTLLFA